MGHSITSYEIVGDWIFSIFTDADGLYKRFLDRTTVL